MIQLGIRVPERLFGESSMSFLYLILGWDWPAIFDRDCVPSWRPIR